MYFNYRPLRKLTGKIHLWLGMTSGIVIIVLGLTGCLYTFIDEIRPLVYHQRLFITTTPAGKMLPLRVLKNSAEKALNKKVPLLDIEIFTDRHRTMVFRYRERNDDANIYTNYFINYDKVYMNPYTGEVVKVENAKWEFFNLVVMMHCTLLLGYLGKQIITWSTVIFIVMLISGLILWWPRNDAAARKRFSFKWKHGASWKRKNYDLHQILGFYIFLIAFFIALTGLSMILPKLDDAIQYVINGGQINAGPAMAGMSHFSVKNNVLAQSDVLDQLLKQSATLDPEISEYRIYAPKSSSAPIIIKNFKEESTHYAFVQNSYDQSTASPIGKIAFSALSNGGKIHEMTYDIHVGAIAGLPGKILVFLASLITASLPASGFLIWKGRKKQLIPSPAAAGTLPV